MIGGGGQVHVCTYCRMVELAIRILFFFFKDLAIIA